ncbi:MAG TPA: putative sulfate exporter family transporter [Bacteroidota bacterium]|nr:putative sulfate exporter family transporter [Bacteroidota bacterium]
MWLKNNSRGIGVSLAVALVAYMLGNSIPLIGGAVFGILIGMLIGTIFPLPSSFASGMNFTSKKILQWAVIILGSGLSLRQVYATGTASVIIILTTITAALVAALLIGRLLKVDFNLKSLIGVGTAICGGSAIAAIAPIIEAEDQEIAYSISTVFLFNVVAVFIFPAIGHALGLSQLGFGLFAGTAINDTSSVVAAGYSYGNEAGDYATIVKLTRTIMIVPIALGFVALMVMRKKQHAQHGQAGTFQFAKIFPWFILGFLFMSAVNTSGILNAHIIALLKELGKFLIVMALSAIGLKTDMKKMASAGYKPILLGLIIWVSVAAASILIQLYAGQW